MVLEGLLAASADCTATLCLPLCLPDCPLEEQVQSETAFIFCCMEKNNKYPEKLIASLTAFFCSICPSLHSPETMKWKLGKQSQGLVLSFCFECGVTMPKAWMGLLCSPGAGRLPFPDPLTGQGQQCFTALFGTELVFPSEEITCL